MSTTTFFYFLKKIEKPKKEGIQEHSEISTHNIQVLTSHVISNQVDSTIMKTVPTLPNDKNKNQFSLEPVESNPNLYTINPNSQQVLIKGTKMTFLSIKNTYN